LKAKKGVISLSEAAEPKQKKPETKESGGLGCLWGCGCMTMLFIVVMLFFLVNFFSSPLLDALYPAITKIQFALFTMFIAFIGSHFIYASFAKWRIIQQHKAFRFSIASLAIAFVIVTVWQYQAPQWVVIGNTAFSEQEVTISEGDIMRFNNPDTGTSQMLCLASHGHCTTIEDGPAELQYPGSPVEPGQTRDARFSHIGNYEVISADKPTLHILIHVEERDVGP
jgi:hypothetical protein